MATRIEVYRLEVTDAELAALMRELAGKGYRLLATWASARRNASRSRSTC